MWRPDDYFERMIEMVKPSMAFEPGTAEELTLWQSQLRSRLVELLGGRPEPAPELNAQTIESADCGSYIRQRVQIETFSGLHMPVYVLIPKRSQAPYKAVIACHGHGYGSKDIVGLQPDGTPKAGEPGYQKNFAVELVNRGFLTVAPELLGFGDRRLADEADKPNSCHRISSLLLAMGQTMAGYRVFETVRCIDYLAARGDVDCGGIGCMGISGGGLVSSFAAAIDERLTAVVVSGYANTFRSSILAMHHCVDNFVPGLSRVAELPDLLALIAPRPLLIEAGERDPIFPVHAADSAYAQLEQVYRIAGAADRLECDRFDGVHEISGRLAYDWLAKQLG